MEISNSFIATSKLIAFKLTEQVITVNLIIYFMAKILSLQINWNFMGNLFVVDMVNKLDFNYHFITGSIDFDIVGLIKGRFKEYS